MRKLISLLWFIISKASLYGNDKFIVVNGTIVNIQYFYYVPF